MFSSTSKGMFRRPSARENQKLSIGSSENLVEPGKTQVQTFQQRMQASNAKNQKSELRVKENIEPNTGGELGDKAAGGNDRLNAANQTQFGRGNQAMASSNSGPRIIAVGGGKGGIGKSFFSANTAVSLTQMGYKVALVDLDLGSANLHTCLGVPSPKVGLFDFVNGSLDSLEEVAVSGGVPRLTLYGGGQEFWQQIRPHSVQKIKLISKLQRLDADYVILDLGAGTHVNTLDFFIFSHAGIVVVVPEPTSIENAYVFLKSVLFRKLQSIVKAIRQEEATISLVNTLADPKIPAPPLLQLQNFAKENPEVGSKILQLMQMTQLGVVMNQVRTKGDAEIGTSITQICKRYFGFNAEFIGSTAYDDDVWRSVRSRRPVC